MLNVPEIEVMRDVGTERVAGSPFNVPICLDDTREDRETEPVMDELDMVPSEMKETRTSWGASPVDQQHSGQLSSGSIREAPENFDADNSFGRCWFALHFCCNKYLAVSSCFWMIGKVLSNRLLLWHFKGKKVFVHVLENAIRFIHLNGGQSTEESSIACYTSMMHPFAVLIFGKKMWHIFFVHTSNCVVGV